MVLKIARPCFAVLAIGIAVSAFGQFFPGPSELWVTDGEMTYTCGGVIEIQSGTVWLWWDQSRQFEAYLVEVTSPGGVTEVVEVLSPPYLLIAEEPGEYCWRVAGGYSTDIIGNYYWSDPSPSCCFTATASPVVTCGDGVCGFEDTAWNCPSDCGMPGGMSGRAGWPVAFGSVPAAVGGQPGEAGTFWRTEGFVYNPGDDDVSFELHFVPDARPEELHTAGPLVLAPEGALYFADLVGQLWNLTDNGSVRLAAEAPLVFTTRTFTGPPGGAKAASEGGTYGQGLHMVPAAIALSQGEEGYLLGLSEDDAFRTNLIVQAVSDGSAQVELTLYHADGTEYGSTVLNVPANAKVQRRLRSFFAWLTHLSNGVVSVRVTSGGPVVAVASVVDAVTGDATTVDAVHAQQVLLPTSAAAKSAAAEAHAVVATVARVDGSNDTHWRSQVHLHNPASVAQTVRLEYRPKAGQRFEATVQVDPKQQVSVEDVVSSLFPQAGDGAGALHIYSPQGVIVNSRTYNRAAGTFGQAIPGLGAGDLIGPGQTGIVAKIHRTPATRCNIGFTEYDGASASVAVTLFARSAGSLVPLATRQYTVAPYANLQVNRVFEDMGVNADYAGALAWVTVISAEGRVYAYASNVDNITGDAEFVPAQLR